MRGCHEMTGARAPRVPSVTPALSASPTPSRPTGPTPAPSVTLSDNLPAPRRHAKPLILRLSPSSASVTAAAISLTSSFCRVHLLPKQYLSGALSDQAALPPRDVQGADERRLPRKALLRAVRRRPGAGIRGAWLHFPAVP